MECCVCWEPILPWKGASFSKEGHCRTEHALCVPCYTQCDACPLCRYHPAEKPLIDAETYLNELRQRKENIHNNKYYRVYQNEYHDILNHMNDIKTIINSIYAINP